MTKKFLLFVIPTIFSCDEEPKAYPAENQDKPNFPANPNEFRYFENNFLKLTNFVANSLQEKLRIKPEEIRQCIRYVVSYENFGKFYNENEKKQFYNQRIHDLIMTLESHYGRILEEEIRNYEASSNKECSFKKVAEKVYGKYIQEIQEFEDVSENIHHSVVCNKMKESLSRMLENLMTKRADIAFLVAMAIIYNQKLSEFLDYDLCKQLETDHADNVDVLRKIFLDELELNEILFFTPDACSDAKKSQRDIFIDYFEHDFQKDYPAISFQNVIRPYLINHENYVVENIREEVKKFFKTHYQKFPIHFQKFTLSLLTKYLQQVGAADKVEVAEFLVLYFLNFYSTQQYFNTFVFSDMGQKMLRYDPFDASETERFNDKIDYIRNFVETNYKEMKIDLLKETTHKNIVNGQNKIIDELIEQFNRAKRL